MNPVTANLRTTTRRGPLAVAVVALTLLASVAAGIPQAHADDVGDLQSRARQIAQRLDELQRQEGTLADQFDGVQIRAQELATTIAATRRHVAHAEQIVEQRRRQLARYSLKAYVGNGGGDDFTAMLEGRQSLALRRDGYTSVAVGDRQQLVDRFVAARQIGDETLAELRRSVAEQTRLRDDLARKQRAADALVAEQEALQAQVQGKLAVAVAQQQKRLAAEAEAEARAKWAAQSGATDPSGSGGTSTTVAGSPATTTPGSPTTSPGTPTTSPGTPTTSPGTPTTVGSSPPSTAPPTTAPPVTPPSVPPSPGGVTAANAAIAQVGVPYSWGGGNSSGPSYGFGSGAHTKGFDCSGLTLYAWAQAGVYLYHNAQMQYDGMRHVSLSSLQVGDLVFYGDSAHTIDHVAIYVGGGSVVHAPHTGSTVQYGTVYLWGGYFPWIGAGRPA